MSLANDVFEKTPSSLTKIHLHISQILFGLDDLVMEHYPNGSIDALETFMRFGRYFNEEKDWRSKQAFNYDLVVLMTNNNFDEKCFGIDIVLVFLL